MTDTNKMEPEQLADYTLIIDADSGYSSQCEGRCTPLQYSNAIAALHGEQFIPASALAALQAENERLREALENVFT